MAKARFPKLHVWQPPEVWGDGHRTKLVTIPSPPKPFGWWVRTLRISRIPTCCWWATLVFRPRRSRPSCSEASMGRGSHRGRRQGVFFGGVLGAATCQEGQIQEATVCSRCWYVFELMSSRISKHCKTQDKEYQSWKPTYRIDLLALRFDGPSPWMLFVPFLGGSGIMRHPGILTIKNLKIEIEPLIFQTELRPSFGPALRPTWDISFSPQTAQTWKRQRLGPTVCRCKRADHPFPCHRVGEGHTSRPFGHLVRRFGPWPTPGPCARARGVRTRFALWAIWAAPLFMSNNLRDIKQSSKAGGSSYLRCCSRHSGESGLTVLALLIDALWDEETSR